MQITKGPVLSEMVCVCLYECVLGAFCAREVWKLHQLLIMVRIMVLDMPALCVCRCAAFPTASYEDEDHPGVCQAMEHAARCFMFDADAAIVEQDGQQLTQEQQQMQQEGTD